MCYRLIKPLLFCLEPERAHHVSFAMAKLAKGFIQQRCYDHPLELAGLSLPNPVGLAAGLDKNAEYLDVLSRYGFGFLEVGTVTPRPQGGNPKPRLFRLKEDNALINRMGFNNKGIDCLLENVAKSNYHGVLGVNIGKNFDTPLDKAIDDYLIGLEKAYSAASYITVNISSPNTKGLRDLQGEQYLSELLLAIKQKQQCLSLSEQTHKPIFIKVAPDLDLVEIEMMADCFVKHQIEGVIATNTLVARPELKSKYKNEKGGLSGRPIHGRSIEVIQQFSKCLGSQIPIIGVGGIDSGESAQGTFDAGADAVQVYTGLLYQGPGLVGRIFKGL